MHEFASSASMIDKKGLSDIPSKIWSSSKLLEKCEFLENDAFGTMYLSPFEFISRDFDENCSEVLYLQKKVSHKMT